MAILVELEDHPSKTCFFWSNLFKIEIMITFLIEMLQLPDFVHMTTTSTYNLIRVIKLCRYNLFIQMPLF